MSVRFRGVFALALWCLGMPAMAGQWRDLGIGNYYYDPLSYSFIGPDARRANILIDNISPSATTFGKSEVLTAIYDCQYPRVILERSTWYQHNMASGRVTQVFKDLDRNGWQQIYSDDEMELRDFLCSMS